MQRIKQRPQIGIDLLGQVAGEKAELFPRFDRGAREVDPRDPTGAVSSSLLWMQKNLFPYPEAEEYRRPPTGRFASYREPPFYMEAERYLDLEIVKPKRG